MPQDGRHRILFLSHFLPYPPDSGAKNRTFNVLRELAQEFQVALLAFYRRKHQPSVDAVRAATEGLERLLEGPVDVVPIPTEHSVLVNVAGHLRSLATGRPYSYYQFHQRRFEQRLREILAGSPPDLVHVDSLDLHRHVTHIPPAIPVACTHHDIESHLLRQRSDTVKSALVARYVHWQGDRMHEIEAGVCPSLAANVTMSELDAARLRAHAPLARTIVVPNGTDTEYFTPGASAEDDSLVAFVGPTYLFANRSAADYLVNEVWPLVRQGNPAARLALIGRSDPDAGRRYGRPGVTLLGQVPDVRPHLREAACSLAPILVGGGTRVKILDSWAMGKAVVCTRIGCEGLAAVDGENVLIRDDARGFAQAIVTLLADRDLRRRLGNAGRATAERLYSWDSVGRQLRNEYRRLITGRLLVPKSQPLT